jgi:hypothetical protein
LLKTEPARWHVPTRNSDNAIVRLPPQTPDKSVGWDLAAGPCLCLFSVGSINKNYPIQYPTLFLWGVVLACRPLAWIVCIRPSPEEGQKKNDILLSLFSDP